MSENITGKQDCCPPFDPAPWQNTFHKWEAKPFIRETVRCFNFIPLNFGSRMRKIGSLAGRAGAGFVDNIGLSDHVSRWRMDIYVAVDRNVPGLENTTLSGRFFSRVYDGPYSDTALWCADYEKEARERGLTVKKWYMWYTVCPKCAKKLGKNQVVIVGEV